MLGSPFFTSEGVIDVVTNALYGTAEESLCGVRIRR